MAEISQLGPNRLGWIDRTKGIGIILVVLGHLSATWAKFVFVFHMPLFFVLSGFLFNANRRPSEYWTAKLHHLAVPYLGFLMLFNLKPCAALLLQMSHGLATVNWHFFKNHFINQIWGGVKLTEGQVIFWFPPVLLFTQLVYYHLNRLFSKLALKILICISYLLALANQWFYPGIQLPLATNVVLGALPFFYFGASLRQNQGSVNLTRFLCLIFLATLVATIFSDLQLEINMRTADYGLPVISLLSALGGSIICFRLAEKIREDSLLSKSLMAVGGGSMTIMYGHEYFMNLFASMHLSYLILTPLIIGLCWGIHWLLTLNHFTSAVFIGASISGDKPSKNGLRQS